MYEMLKFQGKLYIPLCVFDNVYSNQILFKTYYKLWKHEAFHLYACGYSSLGHISLKILHYKLNKNEAFYQYVLRGASLGRQCLRILSYKLHEHEIFHLN